jgi:hypothetical protein
MAQAQVEFSSQSTHIFFSFEFVCRRSTSEDLLARAPASYSASNPTKGCRFFTLKSRAVTTLQAFGITPPLPKPVQDIIHPFPTHAIVE